MIFLNSRWRTAAILKIVFWSQLTSRLSDFSEILCEEAVFHRISVIGRYRHFSAERIFNFPNAVWASASGAFRIVSDTLVLYSHCLRQKR